MVSRITLVLFLVMAITLVIANPGEARSSSASKHATKHKSTAKHSTTRKSRSSKRSGTRKTHRASRAKKKTVSRFIWSVPQNTKPYSASTSAKVKRYFNNGQGARYSPSDLVRAGVFKHAPLRGGIHRRNTSTVSNLIIHSTETGSPADAPRVVKSWNRGGLSHAGAQYLVDRDGKIYQTVDPAYATVHVNTKRAQKGVNNDNSIGIEVVRSGKQKYTKTQLASLVRLVDYIKDRFPISNVYGHGQIQPSNRTDPVAFNWTKFNKDLTYLNASQTAYTKEATSNVDG